MGRRGRARGAPTAGALRRARTARSAAEDRAHKIATRVYSVALDVGEDATYPLELQAPVQTAAEIAAARIVQERHPNVSEGAAEDLVGGVVSYLLAGFFAMALEYDEEHHARFREELTRGDENGGGEAGEA